MDKKEVHKQIYAFCQFTNCAINTTRVCVLHIVYQSIYGKLDKSHVCACRGGGEGGRRGRRVGRGARGGEERRREGEAACGTLI